MTLSAYHGDPALKDRVLTQIAGHRRLDAKAITNAAWAAWDAWAAFVVASADQLIDLLETSTTDKEGATA